MHITNRNLVLKRRKWKCEICSASGNYCLSHVVCLRELPILSNSVRYIWFSLIPEDSLLSPPPPIIQLIISRSPFLIDNFISTERKGCTRGNPIIVLPCTTVIAGGLLA